MHEMSIAEGIVQILEEQAVSQSYSQVKAVWLEIGPLSAIQIEPLMFCFDAVTQGTLAEGALLHITNTQGKALCTQCLKQVEIIQLYDQCSYCGSYQLQITEGDEMRIKELEVA